MVGNNDQIINETNVLRWFKLFVFLLFAAPKINLRIGPIPVYVIDIVLLITWYYSRQLNYVRKNFGLSNYVRAIMILAISSELVFALRTLDFLNPLYLIFRTWLSIGVFFNIQRIIQNELNFRQILVPLFWGSMVTSLLMIFSSLPFTRFLINPIFNIGFLEPAFESVSEQFSDLETAKRGRSLIGVSILSGAFINAAWPLLFGLISKRIKIGYLKTILFPAFSIIMPLAVFMSYSRGAILGVILVILVILLFNLGKYRIKLIALLSIGLMGINFVGLDSDIFYTERLERSTNRTISEGIYSQNQRETERFDAYIEPFKHLFENPQYLLLGEGLSSLKEGEIKKVGILLHNNNMNRADHAVFAKAYYAYGLLAAILYMILFFKAVWMTYGNCSVRNNKGSYLYSRAILASLMGILTWLFFGHGVISAPRGAMLFFFIIGLAEVQRNLKSPPSNKNIMDVK